jgi:integrase/recombinase XerD
MLDSFRIWPHIRARLVASPLGPHLDTFVEALTAAGYSAGMIRCHIRAVDHLGTWLARRKIPATGVDDAILDRFIAGLRRYPSRTHARGKLSGTANGARKFAEFLWDQKIAIRQPVARAGSVRERLVDAFGEHLDRVNQVSPGTRHTYLRYGREFLDVHFGAAELDWAKVTADSVADFVRSKAGELSPSGCRLPVTCTRAFLRFLVLQGTIRAGLEGAVPTVRQWKHASLPRHLTAEATDQLIASCDCASSAGRRDRAMLLLLSRLGLRASEAARLHLADIQWNEGRLLVRAGKTRRERSLPIPHDVGKAIADYLRAGRPTTSARTIFVRATPPYRPLAPAAITSLAQRAFVRAGITATKKGAHTLRHTVATQMVRRGVSFKEVADLLGHRSIDTTTIYAKLDVDKLSGVALPWPGGAE